MSSPLQPALIIGLGGSGLDIARRFRRRLLRDYPDAKHVRFLGLDTDPQSQDTQESPRLPDDEFYHAGNFQTAQYVADGQIANFPAIREWWRSYTNLPHAFISAGAGQRRPVGRLALFVHFDDIKAAIERQLRGIFEAHSFSQLPPEYRRTMTVYIVSSTCGGTGTGMFLDMAYVARQIVPDVMPTVAPKIRGLLLMPSAFIGTGRVPSGAHTALRANAYGALAELDWCMTNTIERPSVPFGTRMGTWQTRRDEPAFKSVFLLGNQDAQGAVYTNWTDLVERGSAHLQITLTSELTKMGQSLLDNVESSIGGRSLVKGRAPVYSSMNADEILLPVARIRARWTKQFAVQLADRLQEGTNRRDDGAYAAALRDLDGAPGFGWLSRMGLKDDLRGLIPKLPEFEGAATTVDPERPEIEPLLRAAQELHSEAMRRIERLKLDNQVGEAVGAIASETDRAVQRALSAGSIDDALAVVARVRDQIEQIVVRAREQRQKLPTSWVPEFGQRLQNVRRGLLGGRARFAGEIGVQAGQALGMSALVWERTLWERMSHALEDSINLPLLRAQLDRKTAQLERIRAQMQGAANLVNRLDEPSVASGMAVSISDGEIDAAFTSEERQERMAVFARESMSDLVFAEAPSIESVANALISIAQRAVDPVANEYVSGASIPSDRVAERLDRLQPLAVFTQEWESLTQGSFALPAERVALLGLPERMAEAEEKDKTIRGRIQVKNREFQTVAIPDQDRVLMMAQHHGFPLFALAETADCLRAFEADRSTQDLRWTLPDADARSWTLEPASPKDAAQWFAVALALGSIRLNAVLGGYVYREGTSDERVLNRNESAPERSREQARDEFSRQGLSDSFKKVLRAEDAKGRDQLYARLNDWLEREHARQAEAGYPATFKTDIEQVRGYAQSIRFA